MPVHGEIRDRVRRNRPPMVVTSIAANAVVRRTVATRTNGSPAANTAQPTIAHDTSPMTAGTAINRSVACTKKSASEATANVPRPGCAYKTTTVVADARSLDDRTLARRLDARLFWKHRVEMRRKDKMRAGRLSRPLAEHVPRTVDAHVLQTERLERLPVRLRAAGFLERRGWDLTQANLFLEELRLVALDAVNGCSHLRVLHQTRADCGWCLLRGISEGRRCVEQS